MFNKIEIIIFKLYINYSILIGCLVGLISTNTYNRTISNFDSSIQQSYRTWKNKFQGITNKNQVLNIIKDDAESFVPTDIDTQVNCNF